MHKTIHKSESKLYLIGHFRAIVACKFPILSILHIFFFENQNQTTIYMCTGNYFMHSVTSCHWLVLFMTACYSGIKVGPEFYFLEIIHLSDSAVRWKNQIRCNQISFTLGTAGKRWDFSLSPVWWQTFYFTSSLGFIVTCRNILHDNFILSKFHLLEISWEDKQRRFNDVPSFSPPILRLVLWCH